MEKELLYRFFDGRTSVDEERRVLDWLDENPAHRQEMLAERRLFDATLMLAQPKKTQRQLISIPRWTREVLKYAAAILVTVGIGEAYMSHKQNELLSCGNTISVPAGQRVDVVLPDGTKVCMNALSELHYPSAFVGRQRKVQLKGEAFFDVTHDAKHPFIVETFACDVEVLGTQFDVEARPEESKFIASLVEGRVRVSDRDNPANNITLAPKERVICTNGRFRIDQIPQHEEFQWREGLIAFRDASFSQLIAEFEKYYGVHITIERKQLPPNRFTGKIRISEGVDHALWILQRSADFKYVRNDTKEQIYIY